MAQRFNPPPNWPAPPKGWRPQPGWRPDPSWPAPPDGWQFWVSEPRFGLRSIGRPKLWALAMLALALLFLPAGAGVSVGFTGLIVFVVGVVALVRGHAWWGWIGSRRLGVLAVIAGLLLSDAGSALTPTPVPEPAASQSAAPSAPSTVPASTTSPTPSVDPDEATPTSTAAVPLTGLFVPRPASGSRCRTGNPLANVYHPYRLQVVSACTTVSGTVRSVRHEDDGDVHVAIALDLPFAGLLTPGNINFQHGLLVVEIVPADEPGCIIGQPPRPPSGTYDYGTCTGDNLTVPVVGSHIWVTGPYVLDHVHNWAEIHPAWQISSNPPAPSAVSTPSHSTTPTPTPTPAPSPVPAPAPAPQPANLSCSASVSNPAPSDYSTVDVFVHTAAGASVQVTANYRTTSTTHSATAASDGNADVPFRISRATPGYTVTVDVHVSGASASGGCSTSFTPQ